VEERRKFGAADPGMLSQSRKKILCQELEQTERRQLRHRGRREE